jgi:hypothetical protein
MVPPLPPLDPSEPIVLPARSTTADPVSASTPLTPPVSASIAVQASDAARSVKVLDELFAQLGGDPGPAVIPDPLASEEVLIHKFDDAVVFAS